MCQSGKDLKPNITANHVKNKFFKHDNAIASGSRVLAPNSSPPRIRAFALWIQEDIRVTFSSGKPWEQKRGERERERERDRDRDRERGGEREGRERRVVPEIKDGAGRRSAHSTCEFLEGGKETQMEKWDCLRLRTTELLKWTGSRMGITP